MGVMFPANRERYMRARKLYQYDRVMRRVLRGCMPISNKDIQRQLAIMALTQRQREVLALVTTGMTRRAIAKQLGISPGTVNRHLREFYQRLHVKNAIEAIVPFLRSLEEQS
jgi:DNA-binding NarL/FixJ family response regulator